MTLYDTLAADYDRFADWPARLAFELPFLERLFQAHGVQSVLDAACGTGRHALALAQRGYQAAGADTSAPMIERARAGPGATGWAPPSCGPSSERIWLAPWRPLASAPSGSTAATTASPSTRR